LGELVSAYTTAKNQQAEVKLLKLTRKVHDLLQLTKLYTVFDIKGRRRPAPSLRSSRRGWGGGWLQPTREGHPAGRDGLFAWHPAFAAKDEADVEHSGLGITRQGSGERVTL